MLVDGLGVGDVGNVVMRDRRHLSEDGLVIVVAAIEPISGRVVSGPELVTRGFVYVRESEELIDGARDTVRAALEKITPGRHARFFQRENAHTRDGVLVFVPAHKAQPYDLAHHSGSVTACRLCAVPGREAH